MRRILIAVLFSLVLPSTVAAQDDDWDIEREPDGAFVSAYLAFDDGFMVATRCSEGAFDVIIGGLPAAPDGDYERMIEVGFDGLDYGPQSWVVGSVPALAFSQLPLPLARYLREGGVLRVRAPAQGDGPARQFVVQIPPSPAAVDETLTACNRPLVDERLGGQAWVIREDGNVDQGLSWVRPPSTYFPQGAAFMELEVAFVVVSCVTNAEGALEDCVVESEHPFGHRFGEAALYATRNARLARDDGGPIVPTMVQFRVNFRLR